jgi:DNA-binding PadR family transcriptional regulator
MLHTLERKGYLISRAERDGQTLRRIYRATPLGAEALELGRQKLRELFREVHP